MAAISIALPAAAQEQDTVVEEIVVTATMARGGGPTPPQVSITVRADFVAFEVTYETATRSEDARRQELERVYAALTQRAARATGLSIEAGTPGRSAPIETAAVGELIEGDGDDRSAIYIVLKVAVRPGDTYAAIRSRAEAFIAEVPLAGRVEATVSDEQFLGISDPKRHRAALVRAIADDMRQLQTAFASPAGPVSVVVNNLESRAITRPSGPLELEIFIPYSMTLHAGGGG